MPFIPRIRLLALAAGTLLSLVVVACRSGEQNPGDSHSLVTSSAAIQATPTPKLRIGYLPITDHLTVISKSHAPPAGVDVGFVKFGSWPEVAEALRAGALDGAYLLAPLAITLRQKGLPLKGVLLGHRNGSALIVRASGEVRIPSDLRGKKIAIPSRFSTHHILIQKVLRDAGLTPGKDVQLLDMKPPEMVNALSSGQIDAFIVAEPFGSQAEMSGVGRVLTLSKDIWPNHVCCILNLLEATIAKHPDSVQAVVRALIQAGHFIEEHPEESAQLSTAYLGQRKEVIQFALGSPKGRVTYGDLLPRESDINDTVRYLRDYGILAETFDPRTYLDDHFAKVALRKP